MAMRFVISITLSTALLVAGCASAGSGPGVGSLSGKAKSKGSFGMSRLNTGKFASDGSYILSRDESSQSCKRIRGKMGIRIVQLRRSGIIRNSSALSRKFSGYFGGTKHGLAKATRSKRDRAILISYNKLLKSKNCPTVDLDTELNKPAFKTATKATTAPAQPKTR